MQSESDILADIPQQTNDTSGFYDFVWFRDTTYATLYIAHKAGKRFLIKTARDNSEWQQRVLRREYELSLGCDHPYIVHIFTFEQNLPIGEAIVMEYIEGRTLADYLLESPSKSERRRIVGELLSAVEYLHKRGIVHNDIKPENILITRTNNTLKLIDFGLSNSDAEYALRSLGCTPRYASPELLQQAQDVDARSDIYSLGAVMEMIVGVTPISRRCLEVNPAARYLNIEQLQHAWTRYNKRWLTATYITVASMLIVLLMMVAILWIGTRDDSRKHRNQLLQVEHNANMAIIERDSQIREVERNARLAIMERDSQIQNIIDAEQQYQIKRDRLISEMNSELRAIAHSSAATIAELQYMDDGLTVVTDFSRRCDSLKTAFLAKSSSSEIRTHIQVEYESLFLTLMSELNRSVLAMPSRDYSTIVNSSKDSTTL